jgi:hypothetical protein
MSGRANADRDAQMRRMVFGAEAGGYHAGGAAVAVTPVPSGRRVNWWVNRTLASFGWL